MSVAHNMHSVDRSSVVWNKKITNAWCMLLFFVPHSPEGFWFTWSIRDIADFITPARSDFRLSRLNIYLV